MASVLVAGACSRGVEPSPETAEAEASADLLTNRLPSRAVGVRAAARLTDGIVAPEGDAWESDRTAVFTATTSFVLYDLGDVRTVRAVFLQADNNDQYVVEISEDGSGFQPVFVARPSPRPGMRARYTDRVAGARGRFVRIRAASGDTSFSLSELKLYESVPSVFPPELPEKVGTPVRDALERALFGLALGVIAFVLLARRGASLWNVAALVAPVAGAVAVADALRESGAIEGHTVSVVRALVALVALVAVVRVRLFRERHPASPVVVSGTLGVCAVLAVLAFYNLARPQFWNDGENRPTFIHYHDMRMYFPVAKYFPELGYDGVYAASLAALEDGPGPDLDRLAANEFRDMTTHGMVRVGDQRELIAGVKARFSPERWRSFVDDMSYFHHSMGLRGYLGSMHDHGANATPVWFLFARALFAGSDASDAVLLLGAAVDLALLLIAFVVIGRTYGLRTMFVAMVVFGANDFYMFGSNWAGSTLRHDWLAYLALGVCALRTKRFTLGGAVLALSAMIRAFPAVALVGAVMPAAWAMLELRRTLGRFPSFREARPALEAFGKIAIGAGASALGLWLLSSIALSFGGWSDWLEKILLLSRDSHVNNVSLRQLCIWADQHGLSRVGAGVLGGVVGTLFAALVFLASRRARPDEAAVLGTFLVPVVFDPANYYLHIVFLLPLLADERPASDRAEVERSPAGPFVSVWIAALAMCVAEYFTVDLELAAHFRFESVALFGCLVSLLAIRMARPRWRGAAPPRVEARADAAIEATP